MIVACICQLTRKDYKLRYSESLAAFSVIAGMHLRMLLRELGVSGS
jgi:hypothetical protein